MVLDYRQVIAQATTGWWKCCDPGTSCAISIDGTTQSGAVASVFLSDLIITTSNEEPVNLTVINGTTGGTVYLLKKEFAGTSGCVFTPSFRVYPKTSMGTGVYIFAESVGKGTVCMAAGGFNV